MNTITNVSVSGIVALATCALLAACAAHDVDDGDVAAPDSGISTDSGSSVKLPGTSTKDAGSGPTKDSGAADGAMSTTTTLPAAPPRQSDLALWLDPQSSVGVQIGSSQVTSWADLTGKAVVTPGNGLSFISKFFVGGHDAVISNNSAVTVTLKSSLGQQPFTVFVVESTISATSGWIFGSNDSTAGYPTHLGLELGPDRTMQLSWSGLNVGGATTAVPLTAQTHIVSLHRHGMGVDVQVDDQPYYDSTSPIVYDAAGVGGAPEQIFFGGVTGIVALGDLIVYDADLSATDMSNVKTYLKGQYGL